MRSRQLITTAVAIGALLAIGACKKGDDKKGDKKGDTADTTGAAKTTAETKPGGDTSLDEKKAMAEKIMAMFEAVGKAMSDNEEDCAKMAATVQKIADDNKALIAQGAKMREDADLKKWFESKHGDRVKAIMTGAVSSMMKKCSNDEGVKKAFEALTAD